MALLADITAIVGENGILTGDDVTARVAAWLRRSPMQARAIVRPSDTGELASVMKLCHEAGQTVVPLGGNTGLVEGGLSKADDLVISLERMNEIEVIDTAGGTMTVQAGVILQTARDYAAEHGFSLAMDFGARGSANIGGCISTNSGGNGVIRYGMMREQVLGLEVVLADGTVMSSLNRMLKNNAGYDLKQLFIGTEGTLGIVTRAVLRLRPQLRSQNTALVAIDDFTNLPKLLNLLGSALGGSLSAFEVLWADFYDTVLASSDRHVAPLPEGHAYYVLVEARGGDQDSDAARFQATLEEALGKEFIVDAAFASSVQQRDAMWAIRDDIETLFEVFDPMLAFDVSLPIGGAADYAAAVHGRLSKRWPDTYRATTFGHLGDGNLHFLLTMGSDEHADQQAVMEVVYSELQPYGGSISAEHGIGLEKRPYLHHSRSDTEIALMKRLKKTLDPRGVLNPGKVFE
jgi:FAD/FMN-containing dehydrogenase